MVNVTSDVLVAQDVQAAQHLLQGVVGALVSSQEFSNERRRLLNHAADALVPLHAADVYSDSHQGSVSFLSAAVEYVRDVGQVGLYFGGVDTDATLHLLVCDVNWGEASWVDDILVEVGTGRGYGVESLYTLRVKVTCGCGESWLVSGLGSMSLVELFTLVAHHSPRSVPSPPPPGFVVRFNLCIGSWLNSTLKGVMVGSGDSAKVVWDEVELPKGIPPEMRWHSLVRRFGLPVVLSPSSGGWVNFSTWLLGTVH